MLLTLDNPSGCFPDTARLPLCNPWSGAEATLPFSVMLLRCHSVSSPFICWALDHFLVSQHLPQRLGSREETKAIFRQINCIVCKTQQVCRLHWQHCRLFVLFLIFLFSSPKTTLSNPSFLCVNCSNRCSGSLLGHNRSLLYKKGLRVLYRYITGDKLV